MDRQTLLKAHQHLTVAIRASEPWHPTYLKNRKTFKALIEQEAQLQSQVAEYFAGLSTRAVNYIDWAKVYPAGVWADASPVFDQSDDSWQEEETLFLNAVLDALILLVATGGVAGQLTYGIDIGINPLMESVLKAAREQAAKLVSGATETTRNLIREAIKQSIARGEDITASKDRIMEVVNNPVRAEMIAQTESVFAYQRGLKNFALETGAVSMTWQALAGACPRCAPLDGQKVGIGDTFDGGVNQPPLHPRCRCSLIYNY